MTANALRLLLVGNGYDHALQTIFWHLADHNYEPVSWGWVRANWQAWLQARPLELCHTRNSGGKAIRSAPRWLPDSSDCDNLAFGVMVHGQVGNALSAVRGDPRGGLAFGVLFYHPGIGGDAHALNWWLDHDDSIRTFEPGNGEEVTLSDKERGSAWFGIAA